MKILILNWRDTKNPEGGGAEVLTHEMARRWVLWGHKVTQISATFSGSKDREVIDGVVIIRRGSGVIRSLRVPVHIAAYFWYQQHGKDFDVVIDEIHGIPFFSPLYVKQPVVALICEVARELWDIAFPVPINLIGHIVENNYFRFYNRIPFLTISPSTESELVAMGVSKKQITVLPMGLTIPRKNPKVLKEKTPSLIYVGRLTKAKGIEDAIEVIDKIHVVIPSVQLSVVGQGDRDYVEYINRLITQKNLEKNVRLYGYVSQEKKFALIEKSWALIAPSMKEGWGLTVPEAGALGVPSIAYNVEGLRDIIINGNNGLLVDSDPESMAQKIIQLRTDPGVYSKIRNGAIESAKKYSWDETARIALKRLEGSV